MLFLMQMGNRHSGIGLAAQVCAGALMLCLSAAAAPDTVSYNRDIRPVLSDKCFTCHGPDKKSRKAGLRLDIEADAKAALRSGETALIPGDRAASALYARITASDPSDRMPPPGNGHELSAEQIETFGRWIDGGAEYEDHWAFVPPVKAAVPEVSNAAWPQNAIDRFVLARLEREGIAPSPEADKRTLLRRLSLDLTGLPPTPEEQERFLADESPFAYEKTVDRLLESPRFGERWARHWLDAARYADSNGYSIDSPREIWPYRDYVINAFNSDKPFDQFVLEQMAGDQLPEATREQHVATGFHRNTMINEEGGVDVEEFRVEAVLDRVNTVGTVFLGLTLGCARCHDHKYDPVSQQEYFSLFAYLNNDAEETLQLPTPEQEQAIAEAKPEAAALRKELADYIAGSSDEQRRFEDKLPLRRLRDLSPEEQTALLKSPENRTEAEQTTALEVFKRMDRTASSLLSKISVLDKVSEGLDTTMVLASLQGGRESHLLIQGSYGSNGEVVEPGVIAALHVPGERGGRRLDLADWLVDPANPLLTRVTVNRFWQRLFGKGIVETESDFGLQGSLPTHPELLDWLAVDFREQGWSIKYAIKQMVMSATYRQSSRPRPDLKEMDPVNTLLARQNRMRLDAEIIRDSALAAAGVLDERIGGPSVYPPQPEGVTNLGQRARDWPVNKDEDRFRRGLYTAIWRATPYYALNVFDAPNGQEACTRRVRSNTPLQSLTLLNDPSYVELAQELAARLMRGDGTPEARIQEAFRLCLGRHPTARESDLLLDLFARQREALTGERAAEVYPKETGDPAEAAAWTMVARAMFNLDEFVTRE